MENASERYVQQIEVARLAVGRGDRSAAVGALRAAIETTRGDAALHREHAAALVRLGILMQELARPADAEQLLTEAIAIAERNLGAEHPSLGVALNQLSRLYIRQSDYSRAEPLLNRLLHIARAKGDRPADVATALAGLALAKRGLGNGAAAELLYRHALRIREEVLAPDHMAIVVTLEQLSETCATRGNVAEAVALLKRALSKRESSLGVEHATVLGLRARIADLERRMPKSSTRVADRPAAPPIPATEVAPAALAPPMLRETSTPGAVSSGHATPDWRATPPRPRFFASTATQPQPAGDLKFLYQPIPATARPSRPTIGPVLTPPHSVAVASSISDTAVVSPRTQSVALARTAPPAQGTALTQLLASAIRPSPAIAAAPVNGVSSRDLSALFSSMKHATRYASAGAAVVVLAIAGSTFSSSDRSESEPTPGLTRTESHPVVVTPVSTSKPQVTVAASTPDATPTGSRAAPVPTAPRPTRVSDIPAAAPSAPVSVPSLRRLVVSGVAMPSLDSLMRTAVQGARDAESEPIRASGSLSTSAHDNDAIVTPPVLISAPSPRFPDELRAQRVDGEVVVQFRVNEKGRVDVSSMQVVQSRHELFTAAVRSVLPKFRFEPAHSTEGGSKPQSAWVQFRAQFTARN